MLELRAKNAVEMFASKPLEDLRKELEYSEQERTRRYKVDNSCLDS